MIACPRCGSHNAPGQPLCSRCGAQLVVASGEMASTLALGGLPPTEPDFPALSPAQPPAQPAQPPPQPPGPTWPDGPPPNPGPSVAAPGAKRTMVGIAPAVPPAAPPPEPTHAPAPVVKRTMMGIAPPVAIPPPASTPQHPAPPAPGAPYAPPPHAPRLKTIAGIAPTAPPAQQDPSAPASSPAIPSKLKTKLGIAHPGIAPLHPGVEKPPPQRSQRPPISVASVPASGELSAEDLAVLPGGSKKSLGVPVWLVLAAIAGALLLLSAIAIVLFWRPSPGITARVLVDDQGRETLEVTCTEPCEYASVELGGRRASFDGGRTTLELDRALVVGENELELQLERQSGGKKSVVLDVPVPYRLRSDFAPLAEATPQIAITVEAGEDSAVVVDGKAVTLDAEGRGRHLVDVSRELTGAEARLLPLDKKLPYSVTRPGFEPERGELAVRIGIVPLLVDAPGASIVVAGENFMLAGSTQRGGTVSVGGRPITVDPSGRFAQLMNVSSVGETTIVVRASAPEHAPRLFPIRVRRVESLEAEAARFGARATRSYVAISSDFAAKRGWAVAFEGEVIEARSENHTTIALLDVTSGCPSRPCLARLVHGARASLEKGATVRVYGHVNGAVGGPKTGTQIPEIAVDFVLPSKGSR